MKSAIRSKWWLAIFVVAGCILLFAAPAYAGSGTVTVNLQDSHNAGLSGGNVYYYQSGWQLLGTTDGAGQVSGSVPVTTDVEIRYAGGTYKWVLVDPTTNPIYTINTVAVTVKLQTCDGTPLVGQAKYSFGGEAVIGDTPATIELLPYSNLGPGQGNYDFKMTYEGRSSGWKTQDISVDRVVVFKTTKVYLFGSNVLYYNNGWQPLNSPREMIGGTDKYGNTSWADFKFDGPSSPTVRLNIDGCSLAGGFLKLVDEAGNPLANYPSDYPVEKRNLQYKYRHGGSWAPSVSFQTDANGQVFVNIDPAYLASWDKKITVTLNQTTTEQNVTVNPVFQAAKVNANLKSCTGPITDVPGGSVDQGGGFWYHHGNTGPSGTVTFYTFPANIKVRMTYNHNSLTLNPTIVAGTNEVDFQTTKVTLTYPSGIKSNMGGSWWMFSKPSMDLLPGTYNFWFQNGTAWYGPVPITVGGCEVSGSYIWLKVRDENGGGVAGATAKPGYGGSWGIQLPGATDANGNLFAEITPGYTKISMTVNQGSVEQSLAQLTASNNTWKTEILRIWLKDHTGTAITDGGAILKQGGGSWYTWGNLSVSGYRDIQLFPGSYKFEMTYNYTSQQLLPVVTTGPGIQNFDFQTGQVIGSSVTQYSTGAWRTFTSGMELMPGTYTFKDPSQLGVVTAGGITNLTP